MNNWQAALIWAGMLAGNFCAALAAVYIYHHKIGNRR